MQLFHFSEEGGIASFVPRPVAVPAPREPGMDWLNGPLVWAIDAWHQPMYLFPRDCPRYLAWPTAATAPEDQTLFRTMTSCRVIVWIEWGWLDRLRDTTIYRYTMPGDSFENLADAGMWVSRETVTPSEIRAITDIPAALDEAGVELRLVPDLAPLQALRGTSLHVSSIRMRNARVRVKEGASGGQG